MIKTQLHPISTRPALYTKHLPLALYQTQQVQDLDRLAIQAQGISGFLLMSKAATATFDVICRKFDGQGSKHLTAFCGVGNNGGDGYVIASLALQAGWSVEIILVGDCDKLTGDALIAYQQAVAAGVPIQYWVAGKCELPLEGVVVDALLGIGLKGNVREDMSEVIGDINQLGLPVCSVDIPSGLCGDTGAVLGSAVKANFTVTYIGVKQGLLTAQGPNMSGELFFAGLDVPDVVYQQIPESSTRIDRCYVDRTLGVRDRSAHKGMFGHVLVVGGDSGMGGAAIMASEAAGYSGAGLVTVLTRGEHVSPLLARCPECMVIDADKHVTAIEEVLGRASVVVIGPGIGKGAWAVGLLQKVFETDLPVVLDADGLNFLASASGKPFRQRGNWILTPHSGEAARLLNISVSEVERDRFASVRMLSQQYSAITVLKGAGTLVASSPIHDRSNVYLANVGNPGMAVGGMGDVLSGVIGGLIAQGYPLRDAASLAVWLHGKAGDCAVKEFGERGLRATDLLTYIRRLANGVQVLCKHR